MTVLVLCGFWPHATAEAAGVLTAEHPALRFKSYENLAPDDDPVGTVVRDLLAEGDTPLVVTVPETYEPDEIRSAWRAQGGGPLTVATVVPADLVLDGITDDTPLEAVDMHLTPGDQRSIGEVVSRQIEQADTVLLAGQPDGDEWEAEQLRVLLRKIAPWSRHCGLDDVRLPEPGRREPLAPVTRGLRGRAVGVHEPLPEHGVVAAVFHARRPFHPARLHEALDEITDGVLRSRGHFWLASRPDLAMTWESAGGLRLGPVSGWLAELPVEHWHTAGDERRLAAEIDWDPYYGDRSHHLAFIGVDLDPVRLHRTLAGCLLSDGELSQGEDVWRRWPDPFTRSYPTATAGSREGL